MSKKSPIVEIVIEHSRCQNGIRVQFVRENGFHVFESEKPENANRLHIVFARALASGENKITVAVWKDGIVVHLDTRDLVAQDLFENGSIY